MLWSSGPNLQSWKQHMYTPDLIMLKLQKLPHSSSTLRDVPFRPIRSPNVRSPAVLLILLTKSARPPYFAVFAREASSRSRSCRSRSPTSANFRSRCCSSSDASCCMAASFASRSIVPFALKSFRRGLRDRTRSGRDECQLCILRTPLA